MESFASQNDNFSDQETALDMLDQTPQLKAEQRSACVPVSDSFTGTLPPPPINSGSCCRLVAGFSPGPQGVLHQQPRDQEQAEVTFPHSRGSRRSPGHATSLPGRHGASAAGVTHLDV